MRAQKFSFLTSPAASTRGYLGASENHFCACYRTPLVFVKTPGLASVELSLKGPPALRRRRCSLTPSVQLLFVFIFPGSSFVLLRRYRVMGTPSASGAPLRDPLASATSNTPRATSRSNTPLSRAASGSQGSLAVWASCPLAPG